jgi:hypothetical protein
MKSYYYVFSPAGHAPRHKHDTFDEAVKESQRLCEMHPDQTFEVLQCVAITSAPKPQVSTFYMDGFAPKDERYIGFPDGMMLPKIPDGYRQAVYRGVGWRSGEICRFGFLDTVSERNWENGCGSTIGWEDCHYCEFIK